MSVTTQLSPTIILMSGVVHEVGILQSELFTSGSQNLVCGGRVFGDTANFSSEIGYFLDPVFKANFFKFLEKYRVYKLPKKKC